eukprot:1158839-Pelagomonas_calceolata.AAC.12
MGMFGGLDEGGQVLGDGPLSPDLCIQSWSTSQELFSTFCSIKTSFHNQAQFLGVETPRSAKVTGIRTKCTAYEIPFQCTTYHPGTSDWHKDLAVQSCTHELEPCTYSPSSSTGQHHFISIDIIECRILLAD